MDRVRIGIVGDFDQGYTAHAATGEALEAAGERIGIDVAYEWVATEKVAADGAAAVDAYDGLWAAPGSPYRSLDGALAAIRFARERGVPFLGT
jgi:CTP synthase (UTP-ammonia lyase)